MMTTVWSKVDDDDDVVKVNTIPAKILFGSRSWLTSLIALRGTCTSLATLFLTIFLYSLKEKDRLSCVFDAVFSSVLVNGRYFWSKHKEQNKNVK